MSYENLASVYDVFMDNVDYDGWCACLTGMLREAGIREGLVCELGCGTGDMTERLARAGYDMIGIDSSAEMLGVAQSKELRRRHPDLAGEDTAQPGKPAETVNSILYLQQDMRSFELYGTVRAGISMCDSLNYITEEEELLQVFRLVNNYLDPGGLFLFDVNTPACYEAIGDQTIAENRPEGSFIWENIYDPDTQLNEYDLTLFLPEPAAAGSAERGQTGGREVLYRKKEETHIQRGYTAETICRLLTEAGLSVVSVTEAYTGQEASADTERLLIAAKETAKSREVST